MSEQVYEQLTLFPEDFRVSLSRVPGSEEARKMTVTSGRRCSELYENSDPLGYLVKMCLESSIWHSTRCLLTWKTRVTPANRLLFQFAVSMPLTEETGCVSWPTPVASSWGSEGHKMLLQRMLDRGMLTQDEFRQMVAGNCGHINPELSEWLMGLRSAFTKLLPTPVASHWKGAKPSRFVGGGHVPERPPRISGIHSAWDCWPYEPGVDRVVDGIPDRVDRVKALGNAVVPQQFYIFFKLMADIEKGKKDRDE